MHISMKIGVEIRQMKLTIVTIGQPADNKSTTVLFAHKILRG